MFSRTRFTKAAFAALLLSTAASARQPDAGSGSGAMAMKMAMDETAMGMEKKDSAMSHGSGMAQGSSSRESGMAHGTRVDSAMGRSGASGESGKMDSKTEH